MSLVKNCFRGFAGGPSFENQKSITFLLEDVEIRLRLPVSNVATDEPPRDINCPFRMKGWFDKHSKQQRQHIYVPIYTELWYYTPSVRIAAGSEYGTLSLSLWLKRVPDNVNARDLPALGNHLTADYDQHYNSSTVGGPEGHGVGLNTGIRKDIAEQSAARATPFSEARMAQEIDLSIQQSGYPAIPPAEMTRINGQQWAFYQEMVPSRSLSRQDFYCLPLDESHYLQLRFKHRVDRADRKAWQEHADMAQRRIIESVNVSRTAT